MTTPFVLITAHRIQPDRADEVRLMAAEYADFVNATEGDMLAHFSYVSDAGDSLTLVHVLVDAAAADRHMEAAAELIGKGIALTEGNVRIDVLGSRPRSEQGAREQPRQRSPGHRRGAGPRGFRPGDERVTS
jgi:quinol monooxygenase YgiN